MLSGSSFRNSSRTSPAIILTDITSLPCYLIGTKLSKTQPAYLAGLIDGEGSLECQKVSQIGGATPQYRIRLSFTFATEEPLKTISQWLGLTPKRYVSTQENRSDRWRLHIPKNQTIPLIRACFPYLILKPKQVELMLRIEEIRLANSPDRKHFGHTKLQRMPMSAVSAMDSLWWQFRSLKSDKRGKPLRRKVML